MPIIIAGAQAQSLKPVLGRCKTIQVEDPLTPEWVQKVSPSHLVSFGYRHILPLTVIDLLPNPPINIHISLLPWNKGRNPNFWSWYENTPKGVTIHEITQGLDEGPVLASREVNFSPTDTLRSSYGLLLSAGLSLFNQHWDNIRLNRLDAQMQETKGSSHTQAEFDSLDNFLDNGWDTLCSTVSARGRARGAWLC